ncbi:MAG: hypothetical protein MUC90_05810, partial [Thermoplasmata archaeon]|nr:hypothetical protein [Thermoplasmata archaeon]
MKGSKCRCGFATVSSRNVCPRCGRNMKAKEWPDEGYVLSFEKLQVIPEGLGEPYNLALVEIDKGPKLVCWTSKKLEVDDPVKIVEQGGKYFCSLKEDLD